MTEFERQIADALAEVRIVTPGLGRIRVGENVGTALAPRIAAALKEAVSAAFQNVNGSPHKNWRDEALSELGRETSEERPQQ